MIPVLDPSADSRARELAQDVLPLPTFTDAASVVLGYLQTTYGFGLWMVTRVAGDDWIVLRSLTETMPVQDGQVMRWSDSLCSRMVVGEGPRVAPRAMDVPAYAAAPIAQQVSIGSYVGVPLTGPTGELFGTLCAVDGAPAPDEMLGSQPLVELQARLLSSLLAVELQAVEHSRRADTAEHHASLDALSGLLNRRGWDAMLAAEEQRCARFASPATVLVLDLDCLKAVNDTAGHAAGDQLIAKAGRILREECRGTDVVARTGGDEFSILCVETPEAVARVAAARLQERLDGSGVGASCGVAGRDPREGGLPAAWHRADQLMYRNKAARRSGGRELFVPASRGSMASGGPVLLG